MITVNLHNVDKVSITETGIGEHRWTQFFFKGADTFELTAFHEIESIISTRDHLWWLALLDQDIFSRIGALPRLCTDYPDLEAYGFSLDSTGVFPNFDQTCFQ